MKGEVKDILVVEDDSEINSLIGEYVRITGREYRPALDGQSALREARTRVPALVILDVMLPDMNGFEVCRLFKQDAELRDVPIVFLSALNDEQSRRNGMECGAADYMAKPFDPDRLMSAMEKYALNGQHA